MSHICKYFHSLVALSSALVFSFFFLFFCFVLLRREKQIEKDPKKLSRVKLDTLLFSWRELSFISFPSLNLILIIYFGLPTRYIAFNSPAKIAFALFNHVVLEINNINSFSVCSSAINSWVFSLFQNK